MNTIKIYTDGACRGNQNANAKGGYGVVILNGEERIELKQGYADTTSNRMELRAVIAGLKFMDQPSKIEIFSDSKYVVDAFRENWIGSWIKNGWKTATKQPVKNPDLWKELLPLVEKHEVAWNWVKGHSGNTENERADSLACAAADSGELFDDALSTDISHLIGSEVINEKSDCSENDPVVASGRTTRNSEVLRGLPQEIIKAVLKQTTSSLQKGDGNYEITTKYNKSALGGEMELDCFYPYDEVLTFPCGLMLKVQWEMDKPFVIVESNER